LPLRSGDIAPEEQVMRSADPADESRQWGITYCLLIVSVALAGFDFLVLAARSP